MPRQPYLIPVFIFFLLSHGALQSLFELPVMILYTPFFFCSVIKSLSTYEVSPFSSIAATFLTSFHHYFQVSGGDLVHLLATTLFNLLPTIFYTSVIFSWPHFSSFYHRRPSLSPHFAIICLVFLDNTSVLLFFPNFIQCLIYVFLLFLCSSVLSHR